MRLVVVLAANRHYQLVILICYIDEDYYKIKVNFMHCFVLYFVYYIQYTVLQQCISDIQHALTVKDCELLY